MGYNEVTLSAFIQPPLGMPGNLHLVCSFNKVRLSVIVPPPLGIGLVTWLHQYQEFITVRVYNSYVALQVGCQKKTGSFF